MRKEGKVEEVTFRKRLEELINEFSQENGSNTPDFILAQFLADCLGAFDKAVKEREEWYGVKTGDKREV